MLYKVLLLKISNYMKKLNMKVAVCFLMQHSEKMEAENTQRIQDNCDRFNKYKTLSDNAAAVVIRGFLHLVRPTEGFAYYSNHEIEMAWRKWLEAEEIFWRMTSQDTAPNYVFPTPPPEDDEHKPCRQMWGLLIQQQVQREHFQAQLIKGAVATIISSEACKSHPATCACKVPNNPWTYNDCVTALEPLKIRHNQRCECGGYRTCRQNCVEDMASAVQKAEAEVAANPGLKAVIASCRCDAQYCAVNCSCIVARVSDALRQIAKQSTYEYKHHVETCACGTCYKARVDSGMDRAYTKSIQQKAASVIERLEGAKKPATSAGLDHPDLAKNIFAAMGTPYDSKCPHGLPFYACMSCSH